MLVAAWFFGIFFGLVLAFSYCAFKSFATFHLAAVFYRLIFRSKLVAFDFHMVVGGVWEVVSRFCAIFFSNRKFIDFYFLYFLLFVAFLSELHNETPLMRQFWSFYELRFDNFTPQTMEKPKFLSHRALRRWKELEVPSLSLTINMNHAWNKLGTWNSLWFVCVRNLLPFT